MHSPIKEKRPRFKKAPAVADHASLALLMAKVLTSSGIEAEIIENGAETIVGLKKCAGDHVLVCSDVTLPGTRSWTLLEWMRTPHPSLPMMLLAGMNGGDFLRKTDWRGAVAAFRKPFSVVEIQQTLAEVLLCL